MRKFVVGRAAWWMLLLACLHACMLAWGAWGGSFGRGRDAESAPLIRSRASRVEKASKNYCYVDLLPRFESGFRPCGVAEEQRRLRLAVRRLRLFPAKR